MEGTAVSSVLLQRSLIQPDLPGEAMLVVSKANAGTILVNLMLTCFDCNDGSGPATKMKAARQINAAASTKRESAQREGA